MVAGSPQDAAARPRGGERVASRCSSCPIDDSWMRDIGPDLRRRRRRRGAPASTSASTPGARSSRPTTATRALGALLVEHLGVALLPRAVRARGRRRSPSTARGTLVTTEQCLLNPNRNPDWTGRRSRTACASYLGVERVVWLGRRPRRRRRHRRPRRQRRRLRRGRARCCSRPCADRRTPTTSRARATADVGCAAAGARGRGASRCSPYVEVGGRAGGRAATSTSTLQRRRDRAAGRPTRRTTRRSRASPRCLSRAARWSACRRAVIAYGGGGVHCITQQVPAADEA